jgi:hypothetical protein
MSDQLSVGRDLSARAGRVCRRLADVVAAAGSTAAGSDEAARFLTEWATSVSPAASLTDPPLPATPLGRVTGRLGLEPAEVDLLLLAGLTHEHEGLASTLRSLHPRALPHVTVGLAARVVDDTEHGRERVRRLLHEGPARRGGVLLVEDGQPYFERSLLVAEGVWPLLRGLDAWPDGVERIQPPEPLPGLDGWLQLPGVRRAAAALNRQPCVVVVATPDPVVGLARCRALGGLVGRGVVAGRVAVDDRWSVGQLCLHAIARDALPVVVPTLRPDQGIPVELAVDGGAGPVMLIATPGTVVLPSEIAMVSLPLGPLGHDDHVRVWSALAADDDLADALAARHPLDPAQAAEVTRDLDAIRGDGAPPGLPEVSAAIRRRAGSVLPSGVTLVAPRADWSRLVLGVESERQLHDAVARWDYQSLVLDEWDLRARARADRGVRLLLTGLPGTGKTLAAEVLATALGTDLIVADISRIVSKWIGETEKNLERVFDVAERTQAVLLLDEADALFGTRTEISDSHDRYANLETAYLLQRLDRFDGLAVLASNLKNNIDAAFLRRLDFVVELGLPDAPARVALWDLHLPADTRGNDIDVGELAERFVVPGGWIRNAAIAAAFLAAPAGGPVHTDHVVMALAREYAKGGKPFPTAPDLAPTRDLRAVQAIRDALGVGARMEEPR